MKYWILSLLLPLATWSSLSAQADTTTSSGLPTDSLRRAQEIIGNTDKQFEEEQADVLSEPPGDALPGDALPDDAMPDDAGGSVDVATDDVEEAPLETLPELPETSGFDVDSMGDIALDLYGETEVPLLSRNSDTISVDFPDEDVRTIIRNVADLYELNVVIPEALVGGVSLKLRDVSWRQVFDVVLEPLNYTWVEDGNIIKIKSLDELLAEPVSTRVFVIDFATAGELSKSISPMIDSSAGGQMQVDVRSNALIITERPSRMTGIQAVLKRLDRPTEQVMIESKFVEVTRRDEKNLGINWNALSGFEVSAGPFDREYTNESGSNRTTNITTNIGDGFDLQNGVTSVDTNLLDDAIQSLSGESRLDTALFSADAFNVILSALENNNEVELVSNPTVVTMNNTVAQINIGEEYPIPQYRYNEERGTFEVSGFDFMPIGILLNVIPQVNSAGFINLEIKPEISSRTGEVNFGGAGGAAIPIITTRKTESAVTIKSGYTLAIGGLMERSTGRTENKVPFLGDLPGVGRLFRSNTDTLDGRNLVIFITAKVLNPDGSSYEEVFDEQTLNEMGISERDIPGFEISNTEKQLYELLKTERDKLESLQKETELKQQLMLLESLKDSAEKREEKRLQKQAEAEAKKQL